MESSMLKSDLINILVAKRGVTQKQAEATIETIFGVMRDSLCRGENIEIRGLGAFHVKRYKGYRGRNPKTGQVIPIKPKRGVLFRTGKELKDRVNRPEPKQAGPDALLDGTGTVDARTTQEPAPTAPASSDSTGNTSSAA
jgi:integration host factor subunit beta